MNFSFNFILAQAEEDVNLQKFSSIHSGGEFVSMLRVGTQVLDAQRSVFGSNAEHWSQLAKTCPKTEILTSKI
jgi:hypothetical protein